MSMLNPSPQARLIMGAAAGLGAAVMAGYARLRVYKADEIEAETKTRLEAALSSFALDEELFEQHIIFLRRHMLAESEAVLGVGVPLLRLCGIRADDIANHPLPEHLRFLKELPPPPEVEPAQPYRARVLGAAEEIHLLVHLPMPGESRAGQIADMGQRLATVALSRAQHGLDKAEAQLATAEARRRQADEYQDKLKAVTADMRAASHVAVGQLEQVRRYAVLVNGTYVPPCWAIARRRRPRNALTQRELSSLRNLGAALRALAAYTAKEMQL